MKHLSLIVITLLISSCCGTKRIAEKTAKQDSKEMAKVEVTETPKTSKSITTVETPKINEETEKEDINTEVTNDVVNLDENSIIIEEVTSIVFDHSLWDDLLQKHVSNKGNVNYKGFRADKKEFNFYLKSLSENPPQESWSKSATLAYWMNVYNAFTVKLILDNYPTKSIKDIKGPWSHRFIKIGEKWYTLNDVEHRIIRKMGEPRIHFALVCAAVSCPKLYNKAFTANNLEEDLSLLTRGFLNDSTKNNISEKGIKLSKIFKWYGGDFKKNGNSLIDFLNAYTDVTISPNAKKSFKDYNWALNE